jgi:hypothetical protein
MTYQVGDRVRSLVVIKSETEICGCDPEVCRDLLPGALGTVDYISPPPHPSRPPRPFDGCGVRFDDDHHQCMSGWMRPHEIAPANTPEEGTK